MTVLGRFSIFPFPPHHYFAPQTDTTADLFELLSIHWPVLVLSAVVVATYTRHHLCHSSLEPRVIFAIGRPEARSKAPLQNVFEVSP